MTPLDFQECNATYQSTLDNARAGTIETRTLEAIVNTVALIQPGGKYDHIPIEELKDYLYAARNDPVYELKQEPEENHTLKNNIPTLG